MSYFLSLDLFTKISDLFSMSSALVEFVVIGTVCQINFNSMTSLFSKQVKLGSSSNKVGYYFLGSDSKRANPFTHTVRFVRNSKRRINYQEKYL